MAAGGWMGLKGANSLPEGCCSLTLIVYELAEQTTTDLINISVPIDEQKRQLAGADRGAEVAARRPLPWARRPAGAHPSPAAGLC